MKDPVVDRLLKRLRRAATECIQSHEDDMAKGVRYAISIVGAWDRAERRRRKQRK